MGKVLRNDGIVIFSRMGSTRLPGKALLPLGKSTVLGCVINQLRYCLGCDELVVATSNLKVDDPIASFAESQGVAVFRGAHSDVIGRTTSCMKFYDFQNIVRISGDSPFIDPELVDKALAIHHELSADITTNIPGRTFPYGQSVEVLSRKAVSELADKTTDAADREHVTSYVYKNKDEFNIQNFTAKSTKYAGLRLVIDTASDYERALRIFSLVGDDSTIVSLEDVVTAATSLEAHS